MTENPTYGECSEPLVQQGDFGSSARLWQHLKMVGLDDPFATDPSMFRRSHIARLLEDTKLDPVALCEHVGHTPPVLYPRQYERYGSARRLLPLAGMTPTETRAREWLDTPEFGAWLFGRHSWCAYYRATKERTVPKKVEGLWDLFWYVDQSHDPYDVTVYELDQMVRPLLLPSECDKMDSYYERLDADEGDDDDDGPVAAPLAVVEDDEADEWWTLERRREFWQWYSHRTRAIQSSYAAARRGWLVECAQREKLPPVGDHQCVRRIVPIEPWPEHGGVYIARMPGTNLVKIGKGNNVRKRLKDLLCGFPHPYELLCVVPGGLGEESRLHRRFAEQRRRNGSGTEWFELSEPMLDLIAGVRSGATLPPDEDSN